MLRALAAAVLSFAVSLTSAHAAEYQLDIARKTVNVTGTPVKKITVNGDIPGPTLHFREGEDVTIRVTNHLNETSSIHWHGLLLPGIMDGVPGTNGFHGISPGETFVYHFPVRQSGTYWYHAHSAGQEQDGLYGSLVIHPKGADTIKSDRDYVVLLSDFKNESAEDIMANVKMDSGYYNYNKRTVGDFFQDAQAKGFDKAWKSAKEWGAMRMSPNRPCRRNWLHIPHERSHATTKLDGAIQAGRARAPALYQCFGHVIFRCADSRPENERGASGRAEYRAGSGR